MGGLPPSGCPTNGLEKCAAHSLSLPASRLTEDQQSSLVEILRRAGGVVRFLDGAEYGIARTNGYLKNAPNEETWRALREKFAADRLEK